MADDTIAAPTDDTTNAGTPAAGDTPAAAAAAAPATAGTIAEGGTEPVPGAAAAPATDWRAKYAGEDATALKRLQRYADEKAFFEGFRNLEKKMGAGEVPKPTLSEAPTPEELKAYREANGIPEKPDGYKVEPPNGYVFGEADKPVLDSFKAHAHGKNWSPAQLNDAVSWWTEQQTKTIAAQAEADAAYKNESIAALAQEWQGADFKANVNAVNNLMATFPEDVADRIRAGRTADGKLIGNDPGFLRAMAQLARELNPAATLLPASAGGGMKGVQDRIAEITRTMVSEPEKYWGDKAMQKELLELNVAQEKLKGRAA